MTLEAGSRLANYEILEPIGAGGMGEVFRGRDTKLGRDVAIKVLPDDFADVPERLERFEREAKLLASLNHTNVATLYGLEHSEGQQFLVMELVEGETLAERIERGPIPYDEARGMLTQIAEGLESAHERGVVHRDLKPANVKITPDGHVKILDFGLAKALGPEDDAVAAEASQSPTLTRGTALGVIMGTAAYMSPEQAKGRIVDTRTDIWAFGAVAYEMLTARRVFAGDDVSEILASVLKDEPDWVRLPSGLPSSASRLLKRCLTRDPRQRLRDIGEARIALGDESIEPAVRDEPAGHARWAWGVAAALALALAFALMTDPAPDVLPPERYELTFPEGTPQSVVFSRDGRRIAYVVGNPSSLYVRELDRVQATRLAGTEGARDPFFSPDGEWVGFFTPAELRKVSISGGAPVTLATVTARNRGATWSESGTIVFAPVAVSPLFRVPEAGGESEPVTELAPEERSHRWPEFLPDGDSVLFSIQDKGEDFNAGRIDVVKLSTGERKPLLEGGYFGRYSPSGHLLYVYDGTLFAVGFDVNRLELAGPSVPVVDQVAHSLYPGVGRFAVGGNDSLMYQTGSSTPRSDLVWVDREGGAVRIDAEPASYIAPRLAPDGTRVAMEIDGDVFVHDLDRAIRSRFTLHEGNDRYPIWSPDGTFVVFNSGRDGTLNLYRKRADGADEPERLLDASDDLRAPSSLSSDGSKIIFTQTRMTTGQDVMVLDVDSGSAEVLLGSPFAELGGNLSPDDRWLAYLSDESGLNEVYVRPFPGPGGAIPISSQGGSEPLWSPTRQELYYVDDRLMMVVPYQIVDREFRPGRPQELFGVEHAAQAFGRRMFDISRDGERFLMLRPVVDGASIQRVVLVRNWFDEIRRLTPND